MDPRDDPSLHNQPQRPPLTHQLQSGHMQPREVMRPMAPPPPFGFAHHYPNTNVFMMGAAGVPNSGPNFGQNPNFAFNPLTAAPHPFETGLGSHPHQQQPPYPQQQQPQQPQPLHDQQMRQNGSPAPAVSAAVTAAATVGTEQVKKKRGRPRKNPSAQDGITIGLSVDSQVESKAVAGGKNENGLGNVEGSREKKRGRPPGSGKKQLAVAGGAASAGLTMHVLVVPAGENIVSKLLELSQESARTICVLAANGPVQNITLRKLAGGTTYLEGQFEIVTLSGSLCDVNNDASQYNNLNLTVSLAGPGSKIVGGGVTRELIAAASIQMIACSFISDKKQSNPGISITPPYHTPTPQMLSFGGSAPPNNTTQQDAGCETSNDDDGSDGDGQGQGDPQNQNPGFYNYGQQWTGGTPTWP